MHCLNVPSANVLSRMFRPDSGPADGDEGMRSFALLDVGGGGMIPPLHCVVAGQHTRLPSRRLWLADWLGLQLAALAPSQPGAGQRPSAALRSVPGAAALLLLPGPGGGDQHQKQPPPEQHRCQSGGADPQPLQQQPAGSHQGHTAQQDRPGLAPPGLELPDRGGGGSGLRASGSGRRLLHPVRHGGLQRLAHCGIHRIGASAAARGTDPEAAPTVMAPGKTVGAGAIRAARG